MKILQPNGFLGVLEAWFGRILKFLRARSVVGGLEVADQSLRFTYWSGRSWQLISLRLPPGVVRSGVIQDPHLFGQALGVLRKQLTLRPEGDRLNVILCPSGANVYTQSFNLPVLDGDGLERAVDLNIRMISPADMSQVYAGWQILNRDVKNPKAWEILGGFMPKPVVDGLVQALNESRFLAVAVESKAIAMTRLMRYWVQGFDSAKPAIVLMLDAMGINLLILRHGQLYFEYVVNWSEVPEAAKGVTRSLLQTILARNLAQVVNFFRQQWPEEQLSDVWISANVLQDEMSQTITHNFSLLPKVIRLKGSQTISPEWHVSLGLGLRGQMQRREDREMSLMGVGAREEFAREEFLGFLSFWRVLIPLVLAVLVGLLLSVDLYLVGVAKVLNDRVNAQPNNSRVKEVADLEKKAQDFNQLVAMIQSIESHANPKRQLLTSLDNALDQSKINLTNLAFRGWSADINMSASAAGEDQLRDFRKAIESDPSFQSISLPISQVRPSPNGGLTFDATIKLAPLKNN